MPRRTDATCRPSLLVCAVAMILVACRSSPPPTPPGQAPVTAPVTAPAGALAGMAAQRVIVLPTYAVRIAPELNWATAIGQTREVKRTLDAEILSELKDRGGVP